MNGRYVGERVATATSISSTKKRSTFPKQKYVFICFSSVLIFFAIIGIIATTITCIGFISFRVHHQPQGSFATNGIRGNDKSEFSLASSSQIAPQFTNQEESSIFVNSLYPDLVTVAIPFNRDKGEIPFFWNVAGASNSFIDILSRCSKSGLVHAGQINPEGVEDNFLRAVGNKNIGRYINVDLTSESGINRAKQLNLVTSRIADFFSSPHLTESLELFSSEQPARAFIFLLHPIFRSVAAFDRMKKEGTITHPSLLAFANSDDPIINNWMIRILTKQKLGTAVTTEHLELAKVILREKFFVGLIRRPEASVNRINAHFGFDLDVNCMFPYVSVQKEAAANNAEVAALPKQPPQLDPEIAEAHRIIGEKNQLDILLFDFAEQLFEEQGKFDSFRVNRRSN